MTAFNFPNVPALNEAFGDYTWDGEKWCLAVSGATELFLQAGAGAVLRTMQNKARDIVSVKDFGAVGNGVADDTAAIQAAVNSVTSITSQGNRVRLCLPTGDYLLSSPIVIPQAALSTSESFGGIIIAGDGIGLTTLLTNSASNSFFTCTVPSGTVLFNLTFQGFTLNANSASYNAFQISTQNVGRVICYDVLFQSSNPSAAAVAGIKLASLAALVFYSHIDNCSFQGSSILFDGVTDSWVSDCVVTCIVGVGGRDTGIKIQNDEGNIKIQGCHIHPGLNGGIHVVGPHLCCGIQDNFFDLDPNNLSAAGINISNASNFVISGNTFSGVNSHAINANGMTASTISGNNFLNCGNKNGGSFHTINLANCTGNVISGNIFRQTTALSPLVAAISESGTSSGNVYGPNAISGGGYLAQPITFSVSGSTSTIVPWQGLVTSASGTAVIASGTTSVSFNHGLAYTPTVNNIFLTNGGSGWGAASKVWVGGISATQITIFVDVNPGTNITFAWRAEVRGNSVSP